MVPAFTGSVGVGNQWANNGSSIYYNGGNVGIGTASPPSPLVVQTSGETSDLQDDVAICDYTNGPYSPAFASWRARGTAAAPLAVQAGDVLGSYGAIPYTGSGWSWPGGVGGNIKYISETNATPTSYPTAIAFETAGPNTLNALERMRITGSGIIGINTQNPSANGLGFAEWGDPRLGIYLNGNDGVDIRNNQTNNFINLWHNGSGSIGYISFSSGSGVPSGVGSITTNGSMTYYNTTSDRRIKENIRNTGLGLTQLMQIPVRDFDFIKDPKHQKVTGFVAQELFKVFPEAVTVNGDNGTEPLGTSTPWSVDYGRVTPLIVKAVQDIASLSDTFKQTLVAWLGDPQNGIQKINTKELCIEKSDGTNVCVSGDQLAALLASHTTRNTP